MRARGWVDPSTYGRPHEGLRHAGAPSVIGELHLGAVPARVLDQGRVGCCTATSTGLAVATLAALAGYVPELPDRVSTYARGRMKLGRLAEDSGASLADVIAGLRRGWQPEREELLAWGPAWTAPPPELPADAPRLVSAEALDYDPATIAWELSLGCPVVVGLRITSAWDDGPETLPDPAGESTGGHAVVLTGYHAERRAWRMRNSWGEAWGDGGEAWLPWSWIRPPWCGEVWSLRAIRRAEERAS